MKKVLIIRTGAIGDVVETTGLLRALVKENYTVDYLMGSVPAQLLKGDPDINKLFIFEKKNYFYLFKLGRKLAKEKYDLILALQNSLRIRVLCTFTGVKNIFYYKRTGKLHAVENFFETGKRAIPELKLDKNIKIYIPDDIKNQMNSMLDNKIRICFNTGASAARQGRKWCVEHWIKLAQLILNKYDAQIYVVGAKEDVENVNKLVEAVPQVLSFAGKTTLQETAALLSNANLVISGDTGPLHIASATETTCLGLYGCCSVSRSGPYGEKHYTIKSGLNCSPCNKKICKYLDSEIDDTPCMRDISPETVLNMVDTILKKML